MILAESMSLGDKINVGVALGTFLLAVATIVLALYTRKSVAESAKARETWEAMALDATRARLDAAAPHVAVESVGVSPSLWAFSQGGPTSNSYNNQWPAAHRWVFDRDARDIICLKLRVNVISSSPYPVQVKTSGTFCWLGQENGVWEFSLPAHGKYELQMLACLTAEQWKQNHEARVKGAPLPHVVAGEITVTDQCESGIDDTWKLTLGGFPIEQVPGNIAEWTELANPDRSEWSTVFPRRRTYFVSRSQDFSIPNTHSVALETRGRLMRELEKMYDERDRFEGLKKRSQRRD